METVGNSLYSLVNEEKGVIPPQAEQRNGLLRVYNESARFVLDWCCGPISTNTGLRVRWTLHVGDLQHVILYHKEHISSPKKQKTKPHFSCYCDAEGATLKIRMHISGKDTWVF